MLRVAIRIECEFHHNPVILFCSLNDRKLVGRCGFLYVGDVGGEETGEEKSTVEEEVLGVGGEVGDDDVFVDVGYDGIELPLDGGCVAKEDFHIICIIKGKVFFCILHAERVDVDGDDLPCSSHRHGYAENACACTHVEDSLIGEIFGKEKGCYLIGCFVRARAKCHAWVQVNAELPFEDWVKTVAFPLLVPVFVFQFVDAVGKIYVGDADVVEGGVETRLAERVSLYVCFDAVVCLLKTVIANFGEHGCEDVACSLGVWCDGDVGKNVSHGVE